MPTSRKDAERIRKIHGVEHRKFGSFLITGIEHEAAALGKTLDQYFHYIVEKMRHEPISLGLKQRILSSVKLVRYRDKAVIVFETEGQAEPSTYNGQYHVRYGSRNQRLEGEELAPLFQRFFAPGG